MICFNESSVYVNESQGSVIAFLTLTNPSSTDIITTVNTTDGTAIGEAKIDAYLYIFTIYILCIHVHNA